MKLMVSLDTSEKYQNINYTVIRNQQTPLVIAVELIVLSRILQNFGYSCITLCHTDSRKYFSPYLQNGRIILCYKILWPCKD